MRHLLVLALLTALPALAQPIPFEIPRTRQFRMDEIQPSMELRVTHRDDLEQIGFVLLYFIRGSLPWQGMAAKTKEEKYQQIKVKKATTTIEDLTHH